MNGPVVVDLRLVPSLELSVYVVLDAGAADGRDLAGIAAAAVRGGARVLQVRDKSPDGRSLLALTRAVAAAVADLGAAAHNVALVVNDRVDVARVAREEGLAVAGVHVGQADTGVGHARAVLGLGSLVGLSVSDERELAAVEALPPRSPSRPDYLGLSPIRATPTKPDAAPALGEDGARRLAAATGLPCVGIGGLSAADCGWLRPAGLAGIAVVTAVLHAADPEAATRELAEAWRRADRVPPGSPGVARRVTAR